MANTVYENFVLANEIENQYNSMLDLMQFCTVDNTLAGTAGMTKKINVYNATNGTEKLAKGVGNSKAIEVDFAPAEYKILLAQNTFKYFDEDTKMVGFYNKEGNLVNSRPAFPNEMQKTMFQVMRKDGTNN